METNTLRPDVPGEIVPRPDATSDDLKVLGLALSDWSKVELRPGGLLRSIDNIVLTELLGGDDPAAVVFAVIYGEDDGDCLTILRRTPPHSDPADAARQLVVACSFRGSVYSRRRAVESLRDAVPAGLVEDVLIDGRSWDLP
ncbi:MAG TPA: hypothetical protein VKA46_03880 [Gemmataceae bacterium]|nr:hypothetical protein [Gemmataceae bacterium]